MRQASAHGEGEEMSTDDEAGDVPPLVALGLRLRKARESKKWTLAKLSEKTKISARHIENIERGDFDKIPSRTLVLGFTKSVCLALKIKPEDVLVTLRTELYDTRDADWQDGLQTKRKGLLSFLSALRS